ncbi:ferritin-like domain-containing protein [Sphingomonas sanguinis]|uniref:ferritin-like domain-containing protein n=1 Tax=Sphingomonas sp. LC-1 TaxID=3110957 RepID=UPI0021BAA3F1|nr:ferritin-like domain-containing protein [Sphingomonas sp. LC-1]MCT8002837.1 ferritin-like domain-containing protein [Sphingomonas sp. LC-1]
MTESAQLLDAFDARVERRNRRRDFFKTAIGAAAAGVTAFTLTSRAGAQAAITDTDILNFALNLEYLEAQFYAYAANGTGLPANQLTGTGTQGAVTGGAQVNFATGNSGDAIIGQYAREIAADEAAHVAFLRTALSSAAVAQPAINISGDANGPFTAAARAAGVVGANETFNPYASPTAFLLGAYIFEDVGVTAYKGASPLISNKTFLQAAAGILAVEAYHAAIVRTTLYGLGYDMTNPQSSLITAAGRISDARDSLDGSTDLDQGIAQTTVNGQLVSNIVPLDNNGIAFSRTPQQVLNIVYLNNAAATLGGFFPAGVNGTLRASAAN